MLQLESGLQLLPEQKIALAIDTPDVYEAERYMAIAKNCGAAMVKMGYELRSKIDEQGCADLASLYELDWIADFKYYAIGKSIFDPVNALVELDYPPIGITVATHSGLVALKLAQKIANNKNIIIFGAGHLSGIDEEETWEYTGRTSAKIMKIEGTKVHNARAKGLVTAGSELPHIKQRHYLRKLITLVVGTRSADVVVAGDDQKRIITPSEAVRLGGDIIVVGRQVTQASNMAKAYDRVAAEIGEVEL